MTDKYVSLLSIVVVLYAHMVPEPCFHPFPCFNQVVFVVSKQPRAYTKKVFLHADCHSIAILICSSNRHSIANLVRSSNIKEHECSVSKVYHEGVIQ